VAVASGSSLASPAVSRPALALAEGAARLWPRLDAAAGIYVAITRACLEAGDVHAAVAASAEASLSVYFMTAPALRVVAVVESVIGALGAPVPPPLPGAAMTAATPADRVLAHAVLAIVRTAVGDLAKAGAALMAARAAEVAAGGGASVGPAADAAVHYAAALVAEAYGRDQEVRRGHRPTCTRQPACVRVCAGRRCGFQGPERPARGRARGLALGHPVRRRGVPGL
jgi:hypothetical protein